MFSTSTQRPPSATSPNTTHKADSGFKLAAAAFFLSSLSLFATDWPQKTSDVRADPAVTFGTLANGLRYAVMPNAEPPDRISLRLCVKSGSFMEAENQRGISHFLEHMAFNGTTHFPADQLVERFQRQGMSFGGDINAHTGQFETVYMLELPKTEAALTADCLQLLRDYADGQKLNTAEIEKERGIILSEKRERDSVQYRTWLAEMMFLFPDSRLSSRDPIGLEEVISKAPRDEFLKLYRTGHVPGRMTVIAVGALDPKTFVPLLEKQFGDMPAPATPQPDPDLSWKPATGPYAALHYEAEAPATNLTLTAVRPYTRGPDRLAARRADLHRAMAHMILSRRLEILAKKPDSPFIFKGAGVSDSYRTATVGELRAECRPEKWQDTLPVLEQELRRALRYGFTTAEITEVKATVFSAAEQEMKAAATRKSGSLANQIGDATLNEEIFTSPADDFALTRKTLAELTPEMLLAEFRGVWDTDVIGIFAAGNLKLDDASLKLLAAYAASRAIAVKPPVEEKGIAFAYTDFGTPGTIVARHEIADLGVTQLTLSNHIRVNLKRTDFEANRIHINVRFGAGTLCAPPTQPGLAVLAGAIFIPGGLGKHSADELERILAGRHVGVSFKADDDCFGLDGATTPEDFTLQLQYLAACLTDPGYRPEAERQARKAFATIYPNLRNTEKGVFSDQVARYLASGDFRFGFPKEADLAARTVQEVRDWLAGPRTNGYMEITIIGDIKPDDAIPGLLKTFGALPAREKKIPAYKKQRDVRFPEPAGTPARFTFASNIQKALALVLWPTGVDRIGDTYAVRRLSVLAQILDDRMRVEIREKLGETYSPFAHVSASDVYPKYGYLLAGAGANPQQAQTLTELMSKIAVEIAAKGITQDELDRALKPILSEIKESLRSNGFWLGVVAGSQQNPIQLTRVRTLEKDFASITPKEVNKFARNYLRAKSAQTVLIVPAGK